MKQTQKTTNPYRHSDSNKRYQTFDYYLKKRFGGKIARIALDAGLSCPNRDGKCGTGGCIYCAGRSGSSVGEGIADQYANGVAVARKKWEPAGFIPYLQAGTNTYAPAARLRELYEEAAALPGAVALAIATRADCLGEEAIAELVRISNRLPVIVELGLQTAKDTTAERINRGHTFADFKRGFDALRAAGGDIAICVHLIVGLPGEGIADAAASARAVADLGADMVKIHLLHVVKGTPLAHMYQAGEYTPMEREEYIAAVCDMIEVLPEDTVVPRVTGDGYDAELIAPRWSRAKMAVINDIDKELYSRGTYQGIHCKKGNEL